MFASRPARGALGPCFRPSPLALAAISLAVAAPAPASADARLEVIDQPSTAGNVDLSVTKLNQGLTKLQTRVLLPDGYDADPQRRWPVLYLLHGLQDNSDAWTAQGRGEFQWRAKGFPGIVVMPEGGRSYWTDAWVDGSRRGGNVRRYVIDEVLPEIEARYRIAPGRQNHAIGGLSMGGYGAMLLAAELPTYFGSIISQSGLLDLQTLPARTVIPASSEMTFESKWGPIGGHYERVSNPKALLDANLKESRMYLSAGDGLVDPSLKWDQEKAIKGGAAELGARIDAQNFRAAAAGRGIDVTLRTRRGIHDWPYWQRDIPAFVAWNPFKAKPSAAPSTSAPKRFRTMSAHGNAWGLGFRFDTLPRYLVDFTYDGRTLTATGAGRVTITPGATDADASGNGTRTDCTFTATIPFKKTMPSGC